MPDKQRTQLPWNGFYKNPFLLFFLLIFCLLIQACSKTNDKKDSSSTKYRQYYVQGETLYIKHCSNCHQKDGTGLGLLYPPLAKSDYMSENLDRVICLIRYGKSGPIVVNGKTFDQPMPPAPSLGDLEIAEIATYIYNSWGNERGIIPVSQVSIVLSECGSK